MWAGLAVFVAVYALLAIPRVGRRLREAAETRWGRWGGAALSRPGIALFGALLVLLLGEVGPRDALRAIDLRTLALLTGMMLLVAALDAANVFAVLASRLTARLRTPRRLLIGTMLVVAILSAFFLNDAVVLLFTPVLIRAASAMAVSPVPFLVAEAIAANLGSAATPSGNPQNAAIANARELDFLAFTTPLLGLAIAGLVVGVAICLAFFWRDLSAAGTTPRAPTPARITDRRTFALAVGCVALAMIGLLVGPRFGIPLWASAFGAGLLALLASPATGTTPRALARRVDGGIIVFFASLFVLIETVRVSGVLDTLSETLGGAGGLVVATALLSNIVSNVPAVLLLLPTIVSDQQALLLAAASTYAGNATFLGSAATVIVAETARREGADFSILKFTLVGLPIAIVTLAMTWWLLGS